MGPAFDSRLTQLFFPGVLFFSLYETSEPPLVEHAGLSEGQMDRLKPSGAVSNPPSWAELDGLDRWKVEREFLFWVVR